jgi:vacuolar protein sorting-associated protein VTA1
MAESLVVPEALKAIKPYMTLSTQLEQRGEKIVAYYCRLYSLQHAMTINQSAPDCKKFLLQLMDILEKTKAHHKNEEAMSSQLVGQAMVEKQALLIFAKADMEDREGKFTKNLVKQFYSSGLLFDSLNYFGDLSEDVINFQNFMRLNFDSISRVFPELRVQF